MLPEIPITILKCDLAAWPGWNIDDHLYDLPPLFQSEIERYRKLSDQKARLVARLMLRQCLKDTGAEHLLETWKRDARNKPFIEGWYPFSISHSGTVVLFAFGPSPVGIDIERTSPVNYTELSVHFHPIELATIHADAHPMERFYDIWVKKEAVLKAVGIGAMADLSSFDCTGMTVEYEGKTWDFSRIDVHREYKCYLCADPGARGVQVNEFRL